jgi:hypothetical protein
MCLIFDLAIMFLEIHSMEWREEYCSIIYYNNEKLEIT